MDLILFITLIIIWIIILISLIWFVSSLHLQKELEKRKLENYEDYASDFGSHFNGEWNRNYRNWEGVKKGQEGVIQGLDYSIWLLIGLTIAIALLPLFLN